MRLFPVLWLAACAIPLGPEVITPDGPVAAEDPEPPSSTLPPVNTTPTTPSPDPDCPTGVICVDTLPYEDTNTTTGAPSALDGYGCAPDTDESGPEVVYRVTLASDGLLAASLDALPAGVDVDVHLLEEREAGACVDRGHWDAAALLPAGTWWVVVDSWVDGEGDVADGAYTLNLHRTHAADYVADGLAADVFETALSAFDHAREDGESDRLELGVIDFSLPSTEPRFFVVDLRRGTLLYAELTSHGIGSQDPNDLRMADRFGNVPGSNMSSIGLLRAAETYSGTHGHSLRLDGLEAGWDDNVRERAIVVHSADYATQDFADGNGYLGRSEGCPAIDPAISTPMIDTLADGALILAYYPDPDWLSSSVFLH